LAVFLNPGPDRSPIRYTQKGMFAMIYSRYQYTCTSL